MNIKKVSGKAVVSEVNHARHQVGKGLGALGVSVLALVSAIFLAKIYFPRIGFPLWDVAEHSWVGVELVRALARGNILRLLDITNRSVLWPFMHGYLLVPFYLLFGISLKSAVLASLTTYVATVITLFFAGIGLDGKPATGFIASILAMLSPLYLIYAGLPMLEIFGALFTALTFCFYLHSIRRPESSVYTYLWGLFLTITVFTKYNYGLFLALAILLNEAWSLRPEQRKWLKEAWSPLPGLVSFRWLAILSLFYLLPLFFALALGGFDIRWQGKPLVALHRPGKPLYYYLLFLLVWIWFNRRHLPVLPHNSRLRLLLKTTFLPILIWFLIPYPNRVDNFIRFTVSGSTGVPILSWHGLSFYFRSLATDYFSSVMLFVLVVLLFGLSFLWKKRAIRVVQIYAILVFLLMTVHQFKEARAIFTLLPALWLCASTTASRLLLRIPSVLSRRIMTTLLVLSLGVYGFLAVPSIYGRKLPDAYPSYHAPSGLDNMLSYLDLHTQDVKSFRYIGASNVLNPGLFRWHFLVPRPGFALAGGVPREPSYLERKLTHWRTGYEPLPPRWSEEMVAIFEIPPASPLYNLGDARTQAEERHLVEKRKLLSPYALYGDTSFAALGIRLKVYKRH